MQLERQVGLLKILADGYKKHPAYRAIRPATGNCEPCVKMWKARLNLKKLENEQRTRYDRQRHRHTDCHGCSYLHSVLVDTRLDSAFPAAQFNLGDFLFGSFISNRLLPHAVTWHFWPI